MYTHKSTHINTGREAANIILIQDGVRQVSKSLPSFAPTVDLLWMDKHALSLVSIRK